MGNFQLEPLKNMKDFSFEKQSKSEKIKKSWSGKKKNY